MLAIFPALLSAQDIQLPTIEIRASQDKVPLMVKEAVLSDFGESHKPMVWVTDNSLFKRGEWEQITNIEDMDVLSYSVNVKTSTGCTLNAVYTPDGKLISSREYFRNFTPAQKILMALQNSEYKDWGIKKSFHVIKASSKGIENERYALILKKGSDKKTVYIKENKGEKATVYSEPNNRMISLRKWDLADGNW